MGLERLAQRFGSAKAGALLRDWHITTGQYYRAKVLAALEKRLWRLTCDDAHRQAFLVHLDQSVVLYRQLAELTARTYLAATDMITTLSWDAGLKAAEDDLALQKR